MAQAGPKESSRAAVVTIVARHSGVVAGGMIEWDTFGLQGLRLPAAALGQDDVALLAVAECDLALVVSSKMIVVMAAGAAGPILVADVVGIIPPACLHFREKIVLVNLLH